MLTSEFDYELPEELIAHFPCENRDCSNLMVLNRHDKAIRHKKFFDIVDFLGKNDVLILNNTKVIPARLIGKKFTGANIEVFLVERKSETVWETLIKPSKRVKEGTIIEFSSELRAEILKRIPNDKWEVKFVFEGNFFEILDRVGNIPLPPYIERKLANETLKQLDYERYQTVYAKNPGSVAAPTAGLHFTPQVLDRLKEKGVEIGYVNLNVGLGTFRPVKTESILEHQMDREFYEIPESTAGLINRAKKQGKKIVAVGTTSVRTLESSFAENGEISATSGWSRMFIYPGYDFKVVDKLITNFHLPKSTLIMLVSALAGKDFVFEAYKQAIEQKYRFYSYGDCMLIE